MRFIKTFVLHLYIDTESPRRLCGNVRPIEDMINHSFKNVHELESLLHQLASKLAEGDVPLPGAEADHDA